MCMTAHIAGKQSLEDSAGGNPGAKVLEQQHTQSSGYT